MALLTEKDLKKEAKQNRENFACQLNTACYSGRVKKLFERSDAVGRHSKYVSRLEYLKTAKEFGLVALALTVYKEQGKIPKPEKEFRSDYKKFENIWNLPDVSQFLFELFGDPGTVLEQNTIPKVGEKFLYFLSLGRAIDTYIEKFASFLHEPDIHKLTVSMDDFLHLALLTSWFKIEDPTSTILLCNSQTQMYLQNISETITNFAYEKLTTFTISKKFDSSNQEDQALLDMVYEELIEALGNWSFLTLGLDWTRKKFYTDYRKYLVPSKENPVLEKPIDFNSKKHIFYKGISIVSNLINEDLAEKFKNPFL